MEHAAVPQVLAKDLHTSSFRSWQGTLRSTPALQ